MSGWKATFIAGLILVGALGIVSGDRLLSGQTATFPSLGTGLEF